MCSKSVRMPDVGLATPSLERQEQYWEYWQATRSVNEWVAKRAQTVMELVGALPLEKPKILDFGCGTGWFAEELVRYGEVTGVDLSAKAMAEAVQRAPNVRFLAGDLFQVPAAQASFDVVVSMQVIAHVNDQRRFMGRAAELLRPGGYLVLTTNNRFVMERQGNLGLESHQAFGHIERWLSAKDLKRLALESFRILHLKSLLPLGDGGILRLVNSPKLNWVAEAVVGTDNVRRLKERMGLGYYIILLAQKPE